MMQDNDLFGLIFTLVVLTLYAIKWLWERWSKLRNPKTYAEKKAARDKELKEFLKSVENDWYGEEEEGPVKLPPVPKIPVPIAKKPKPSHRIPGEGFSSNLEKTHLKGLPVEPDSYTVEKRAKVSNAERMLQQLPSARRMVVYSVIFGPPKSLEKW